MYQKSKPSLQHQRQLLLHNSVIHSFILQMPWHILNPHLLLTIVCSSLFSFLNFLKLTFCCPFLVHFWICHTSQKSNLANFLVTIDILFWLSGFPMTWQVRKKESIINTYTILKEIWASRICNPWQWYSKIHKFRFQGGVSMPKRLFLKVSKEAFFFPSIALLLLHHNLLLSLLV